MLSDCGTLNRDVRFLQRGLRGGARQMTVFFTFYVGAYSSTVSHRIRYQHLIRPQISSLSSSDMCCDKYAKISRYLSGMIKSAFFVLCLSLCSVSCQICHACSGVGLCGRLLHRIFMLSYVWVSVWCVLSNLPCLFRRRII